jgi:hypothetical protein
MVFFRKYLYAFVLWGLVCTSFCFGEVYRLKISDPSLRRCFDIWDRLYEKVYRSSSRDREIEEWRAEGSLGPNVWEKLRSSFNRKYYLQQDGCCIMVHYILILERERDMVFNKEESVLLQKIMNSSFGYYIIQKDIVINFMVKKYLSAEDSEFLKHLELPKIFGAIRECFQPIPAEGTEEEEASEEPIPLERPVKGKKRSFWRSCFPW